MVSLMACTFIMTGGNPCVLQGVTVDAVVEKSR